MATYILFSRSTSVGFRPSNEGELPTRVAIIEAETGFLPSFDFDGNMPTIVGDMPTMTIAKVLFPKARLAVLSELTKANESGLHLREIARRTELNSKTVLRELHALRGAGILSSKPVGRQVLYRLNPDCPIYEELRSIVRKTVGLAGVLSKTLEPLHERIELAYVYGSHARGEERPGSDVDLMIVGDVTLRELSPLLREAGRTLGRVVHPTLYRKDEYAEELAIEGSFVARMHHGTRIALWGTKT